VIPTIDCPRESEVLSAILARRWPDQCGGELRAHAARCAICDELAMVAGVLREDHDISGRDVRVPAAGQVWWRAAMRARLEAVQAAGRPITWIHGLTGASAAGLTVAAAGLAWPSVRDVIGWAGARMTAFDPESVAVAGLVGDTVLRAFPVAIVIAAALVLAPIALYFALSDD
jgi:hypothetical protein